MAEMLEAVECDMNGVHQISTIKIDGGMTVNELFNQIQSDILGRKIIRPAFTEMTAMGACIAAQIGIGMLSFEELLCREVKEAKAYQPNSTFEERRTRLNIWKDAVRRALHWNTQTNIGH
ncbi:hypothetical protein AB6A40_009673 [Gnathostoma spinigerum]|uniref:Carbohydrate kinase FGGY C-terminal domain-containing protein n=1 Tax=Gnathostoma spinigerum TaxID=75299 RepID=A0ABD6ESL7_9BILA